MVGVPTIRGMMQGGRLAFVIRPIEGIVHREHIEVKVLKKATANSKARHSFERVVKEEPGGYMVYFPMGHAIRVRTDATLREFGLDGEAEVVDVSGLYDPKSPAGRLMVAQNEQAKKAAFVDLEKQVIDYVARKVGRDLLNRDDPVVAPVKG